MAVPTITDLTPATGPSGGRSVVVITGTNFNLPPVQDPGPPVPRSPSVEVLFNGVPALEVAVESATRIVVVAPPFYGAGNFAVQDIIPPVAVQVRNVDQAGVLIGAESVTAANAYRYVRPPLRPPDATQEQQVYQRVVREVVEICARQIVPNSTIGTHVDFGVHGEVTTARAKLPACLLVGPRMSEDMTSRHHWSDFYSVLGADPAERLWPGFLVNMVFDMVLVSDSRAELYALLQSATEMFMRTPYVNIPSVVGDFTSSLHEFPLHFDTAFSVAMPDPDSNISTASAVFSVRRVPIRLDEPVALDHLVDEGDLEGDDQDPGTFATDP